MTTRHGDREKISSMIHREKALLAIRFKTPLWASRLSARFK